MSLPEVERPLQHALDSYELTAEERARILGSGATPLSTPPGSGAREN